MFQETDLMRKLQMQQLELKRLKEKKDEICRLETLLNSGLDSSICRQIDEVTGIDPGNYPNIVPLLPAEFLSCTQSIGADGKASVRTNTETSRRTCQVSPGGFQENKIPRVDTDPRSTHCQNEAKSSSQTKLLQQGDQQMENNGNSTTTNGKDTISRVRKIKKNRQKRRTEMRTKYRDGWIPFNEELCDKIKNAVLRAMLKLKKKKVAKREQNVEKCQSLHVKILLSKLKRVPGAEPVEPQATPQANPQETPQANPQETPQSLKMKGDKMVACSEQPNMGVGVRSVSAQEVVAGRASLKHDRDSSVIKRSNANNKEGKAPPGAASNVTPDNLMRIRFDDPKRTQPNHPRTQSQRLLPMKVPFPGSPPPRKIGKSSNPMSEQDPRNEVLCCRQIRFQNAFVTVRFCNNSTIGFFGPFREPKVISYKPDAIIIMVIDKTRYKLKVGEKQRVILDDVPYYVSAGTPGWEICVNDMYFKYSSTDLHKKLELSCQPHTFRIIPPIISNFVVKDTVRYDLCAGEVSLYITATERINLALDTREQKHYIGVEGVKFRFQRGFKYILINKERYVTKFGSKTPPSPFSVVLENGEKHFLRFGKISSETMQAMKSYSTANSSTVPGRVQDKAGLQKQ